MNAYTSSEIGKARDVEITKLISAAEGESWLERPSSFATLAARRSEKERAQFFA
jgi:hypothetical protein